MRYDEALRAVLAFVPLVVFGQQIGTVSASATGTGVAASVDTQSKIFQRIAAGGGWETQFVFVNMSSVRIVATQFYTDSGGLAFVLADRIPILGSQTGALYIQSDQNQLSALGIRMNVAGGRTFTSIPILNWSGMF